MNTITDIRLIGPFKQLLTMEDIPLKGAVPDTQLNILENAGLLVKYPHILKISPYNDLYQEAQNYHYQIEHLQEDLIALPGFIDPHTHICWAGSRSRDYTMRLEGKTYLEISRSGGGIWDTVQKTRSASFQKLLSGVQARLQSMFQNGITTAEVKSGYCLNIEGELKMLRVIREADRQGIIDLIPTCLAAHIPAKDFSGSPAAYLSCLVNELLPQVKLENLAQRVDIFVEAGAFSEAEAERYLRQALIREFDITLHADQFSSGGSRLAVQLNARSVDHLEASTSKEIALLAQSPVIPVALPGASIGLGYNFTPARALLDAGASLAIGSDWNPGSAPMGNLLTQAAILGIYERLTTIETFAAITFRAAAALGLFDRGILRKGNLADFTAFPGSDYREILYHQGSLKPVMLWKNGHPYHLEQDDRKTS